MSILIDSHSDPLAKSTDLASPVKHIGEDQDGEYLIPSPVRLTPAQREASDATLAYWMERASQAGREYRASKLYQPGFLGRSRQHRKETI